MVALASASGSSLHPKPGTKVPSMSALISVGRNGADAGMVKTRGVGAMVWRVVAVTRGLVPRISLKAGTAVHNQDGRAKAPAKTREVVYTTLAAIAASAAATAS